MATLTAPSDAMVQALLGNEGYEIAGEVLYARFDAIRITRVGMELRIALAFRGHVLGEVLPGMNISLCGDGDSYNITGIEGRQQITLGST